jgi:hypothetical protein
VVIVSFTAALAQQKYDGIDYLRPKTIKEKNSHLVTGSVRFDGDNKAMDFLDETGVSLVRISYEKITGLHNVTKGVGPTLVHFHGPRRFLRILYTDAEAKPGSVVMTADKGEAWNVMLAAQAASGKKIEDKDTCCVWF